MARRCQINADQRRVLCERFKEGMNLVNRATEEMRTSVTKKTGLTLKSVNVSLHDRLQLILCLTTLQCCLQLYYSHGLLLS